MNASLITTFGTEQSYQIDKSGLNKGILTGVFSDARGK